MLKFNIFDTLEILPFFVRDLPEGVYFWQADVRAGRLVLRR